MRRKTRYLSVMLVLLFTGALSLSLNDRESADGSLVSANPPDGAILATPPATVVLRFSAALDLASSHLTILTAAGASTVDGAAGQPDPETIAQPVRIAASGELTVAYHVILVDGTSVTVAYRFSVGTGASPATLDAAARQAATSSVAQHGHQIDPIGATMLVIDGVVLVVVILLLRLRPHDRRPMSLRRSAGSTNPTTTREPE